MCNLIKRCSRCKKYKFKWSFNKNKSKKDGLQYQCRYCQHHYHNTKWYPKKKKHHIEQVRKNKQKRRRYNFKRVIKDYFSKGCIDCGEMDIKVLEFDHVRGTKKRVGKRGLEGVSYLIRHGYKWDTVKEEIEKCEVRCRNCHKKKTWNDNNYYEDMKEVVNYYGTKRKEAS